MMNPTSDFVPASAGYVRILTIAGSDSGGGAGIQADLKTALALGCYGMTAITAVTAQNTQGVRAIQAVSPDFLRQQIDAVVEDIGVDAVKIGMLHQPEVVQVVAEALDRHQIRTVVLDPVMVATSGDRLMAAGTVAVMVRELFPRVMVITPNLDEAAWLLNEPVAEAGSALDAVAKGLLGLGAPAVLLKGGHLPGPQLTDVLMSADGFHRRWEGSRIHSRNTHGTGCSLSTALACHLAQGWALVDAVDAARAYVRQALLAGADMQVGSGSGPLNHGFAPVPAVRRPLT